MPQQYYIYFITNKTNSTIYTGVTRDLSRRVYEHKNKLLNGFSKRYNLNKLVYYEAFENINDAIKREKQIKSGSRRDKIDLIIKNHADWKDLYDEIVS
ncbi:MAG: GIY-YIG nuclease family protein [Alphaproteobacteria bacterium]|nr:GIY-YIG nuclease family protein [Alphaproteobacteria bacterium]